MSGSVFGKLFTVTNFGESHGKAIGCIVDGCPAKFPLTEEDIQVELDRRKPGTSSFVTQRKEADKVEILSGVYQGLTTGTPIALLIKNTDQKSQDYSEIEKTFRPGHADFTYFKKYGIRDPRGGGRSSARLTAPTVAAGSIARKFLKEYFGTEFNACIIQIGEKKIDFESFDFVNKNPLFAPIKNTQNLEDYLMEIRKSGDSCGAKIFLQAINVPVGLGEPLYDKLDADIAFAMIGLNAVKGVEIGAGFDSVSQLGSQHGDSLTKSGFLTNNSGGILGGISTGQNIEIKLAIKPTSSILKPRASLDIYGNEVEVVTKGRHDPCVGLRAVPIVEALLALVLMDHVLLNNSRKFDK